MTAIPQKKQTAASRGQLADKLTETADRTAPPVVVGAKVIARDLSCTPRFVHILHVEGKIPGYRFGKACIRFNRAEVLAALGIKTEAATSGSAQ